MKYLVVLVLALVGIVVADNPADYVPKAFFYIDEHGNPTPARPINAEILNRARRQVQPPFQPFGQPGFGFQQPGFGFPAGGQGQGQFVSTSQTLSSRFGEDDVVSGQSTIVTTGKDGKVQQTNTYLRPDGTVYTEKHSGRVKRQQSQNQAQNSDKGTQTQQQVQNGGQQLQTQSQGDEPAQTFNLAGQPQNPPANEQPANIQPANIQPVAEDRIPERIPDNQNYPQTENRNPQYAQQPGGYPAQPGGYPAQPGAYLGASPFGFGGFGPQGFPQQGFGFPQQGFGFPQAGFGFPQAGFGAPGFVQPGFGFGFPVNPGFVPAQGGIGTGGLDSRFSEDDDGVVTTGTVTSGGVSTFGGNGVVHTTTSVTGPDGKTTTTHTTNKGAGGAGGLESRFSDDSHPNTGSSQVFTSTTSVRRPDGKVVTTTSTNQGGGLASRFAEDSPTVVTTGGTHTSSSNNGVYQSTSSVTRPDGKTVTTHSTNRGTGLDSRFSGDSHPTVVTTGGTQTSSSNNGVYQSTSSVTGPDGKVYTTHSTNQGGVGGLQSRFSEDGPVNNFGAFPFGAPMFPNPFLTPNIPNIPVHGGAVHSRFSEDGPVTGVSGGTQTFSTNNGVFHSTSSVTGPDGKTVTTHKTNQPKNG